MSFLERCAGCEAFVQRGIEETEAAIRAGQMNARGYIPEEWAAKERRRQLPLWEA